LNKKTIIIIGIIIGFVVTAYCSFEIGYAHCYYTTHDFKCCGLMESIEKRTEDYSPSCKELRNISNPTIVKKGNDYFIVHSTEHYFYVFGINIEPGKPPQTHWWGAGTEELLKECNDK